MRSARANVGQPADGHGGGPRTQRREARRRRRRLLTVLAAIVVVALGGVAAFAAITTLGLDEELAARFGAEEPAGETVEADLEAEAPPEDADQRTLLVATVAEEGGEATSVTLLASRGPEHDAAVLFLPVDTLVRVPGFGLERLAQAHGYGDAELLGATVENVLGAQLDAVAVATDEGFADFLGRAAPVRLEVGSELVATAADGSREVVVPAGEHELDGEGLGAVWQFVDDGDELDAFGRRQRVLDGVLAAATDGTVRDRLVGDGAPQLRTDAEPAWVRELVTDLVVARADEELRWSLLPVERVAGEQAAYRPDEDAIVELVGGLLDAPGLAAGDSVRVQVLNGVGTPGIGRQVDARMDDARFRLALSGNADSFDVEETRILVYDEQPATLDAARSLRDQLGVGTIQVSRQPQSVIDLTVVVGADFVAAADAPEGEAPEGDEGEADDEESSP